MSVNKEQMRNLDFWGTDLKSLHTSALSQSNDIRPCLHVFPTQPIILNIWWVMKALLVLQTLKHTARHTGYWLHWSLLLLVLPAVLPCSVFKGCDHSGMIYTVQTDVLQYSREEEYVCILKRHCGGVCQLSMKSGGKKDWFTSGAKSFKHLAAPVGCSEAMQICSKMTE